jgi:hypothetical protein
MKISQAAKIWIDYHLTKSKKNTVMANSLLESNNLIGAQSPFL